MSAESGPVQPLATASHQLVFDLPLREATGAGDFFVSGSNAAAAELVERWPDWPQSSAILVGPAASGKSHLATVWAHKASAHNVTASAIDEATIALFQRDDVQAVVIEDLHIGIADDRILFHLLNHARETGRYLLLTSQIAPGDLDVALPDLRSRLRALAVLTISEPDDALLSAVIIKLFADRQLSVDPTVVSYLARHMDRSMAAARNVVAAIDTLALTRQRKVTRATASDALMSLKTTTEG